MAKTRTQYVCQNCGSATLKWMGRCPDCGEWNTLVEVVVEERKPSGRPSAPPTSRPERLSQVPSAELERLPLPMAEFSRVLGGGVVPGSLILIGGDPGIGKCVTADTRVLDPATGDYLPITAWQTQRRAVLSMDEATLRLNPSSVSEFHARGQRDIVRLTTRLGHQLRCTPSHPVFTPQGWKPVGQLQPGDRIASPRSLPFFGNEPMSEVEIKLIAYVLSEGSTRSNVNITTSLPEVAADLEEIATAFGMQLVRYPKRKSAAIQYRFTNHREGRRQARAEVADALRRIQKQKGISWAEWARRAGVNYAVLNAWRRGNCVPTESELRALANAVGVPVADLAPEARDRAEMTTPIARFLERHGLRHTRAADKAVPPCIFRLPRPQLALFLRTLFTGDGSIFVNRRGLIGLSYSTTSRRLAEDVQHLLLRFGVITRLRTKHHKVNGADYVSYEVGGMGAKRTQAFVSEIGIVGRDRALAALVSRAPRYESSQADTVPTGEVFWQVLEEASGRLPFRLLSQRAGVVIRNRRRERPLRRATVAQLAEAFPHPRLQALGFGDIYWDEVMSIEPDGTAEVYDLTVPGSANFVANNLILHNSTLLSQVAGRMADHSGPVLYVSGEESTSQIKMRADRLGIRSDQLYLLTETNLEHILEHIQTVGARVVVIDSIQTVYLEQLPSTAGSVSQVRECAARLQGLAKSSGVAIFLVGHVTKEGAIAGPRVLEHIVDVVLYLEGDRFHTYRLLRSVKNRFGATAEVGVFEMQDNGMVEVPNPSEAFLAERMVNAPGSAIAVTLEGTRPLLVEIQALVSASSLAQPRRTPNGIDFNRLLLITAVLMKRCNLRLYDQDVFVNVVGGLTINEPAADLAVALAIASSVRDRPVAADLAAIGEIGLSGEVRLVGQLPVRLNEAAKLGFRRCLVPRGLRRHGDGPDGIEVIGVRSVAEAVELALV